MSTRYDARRSYQRTAVDRHSAAIVSLLMAAVVVGVLVFAAITVKSEADTFVDGFRQQTGQWLLASG